MSARAPALVPTLLRFPSGAARRDSWGRLLELSPAMASLSTPFELDKGDGVSLSFELGGETFAEVGAVVSYVERDADGQLLAELRFTDELARRRLSLVLLDILARS